MQTKVWMTLLVVALVAFGAGCFGEDDGQGGGSSGGASEQEATTDQMDQDAAPENLREGTAPGSG